MRAVVYALGLVSCGGRVEPLSDVPARPGHAASPGDATCALTDDEVLGFAVDDGAIWRVQLDCRPSESGLVVVREDRATAERAIVAEGVWGAPPVTLAGRALVLRDRRKLLRVRTDTGAVDALAIRPQLVATDGDATYVAVDGASESRYALLRVGAEGEATTVGTVPATFQMQAVAASRGVVFATLWSVCSGASSCAGLYAIGPSGAEKLADWPVADLGASLGPLATTHDRAVTAVGSSIAEASGGSVRTITKLEDGSVVGSIALGANGSTYVCVAPKDASGVGRIVGIAADGAVRDLATGSCGQMVWSKGELFWNTPIVRERYGLTLTVSSIGRLRTD